MTEPGSRRRGAAFGQDRTNIGEVSDPAFVRLPVPGTVFAVRSARFAAVAPGNPLAAYLVFLSRLAGVQHAAQERFAVSEIGHGGMLARTLSRDDGFADILAWFVQHAAVQDAPEAAEQARARLLSMSAEERMVLAQAVREGAYPAEKLGECLYVAAALQVHLTPLAARVNAADLRPAGDGVCPACGSGPVASLLVGWANADRARYCCCSLCATMWHCVRIRCTACGSTAGISYYLLEEQSRDIAVETCTACRSYIKHLHQHSKPEIEPFADDIASFGLDLLVREKDFRRATASPLMVVA